MHESYKANPNLPNSKQTVTERHEEVKGTIPTKDESEVDDKEVEEELEEELPDMDKKKKQI